MYGDGNVMGIVDVKGAPGVPHKAVVEASRKGNLKDTLVAVNHRWQSEATDGPKGGWSCVFWEW